MMCHSEWSEANPPPRRIGGKNLKTGNYTEFRDISVGFHLRCGELNMTNLGLANVSNRTRMTRICYSPCLPRLFFAMRQLKKIVNLINPLINQWVKGKP